MIDSELLMERIAELEDALTGEQWIKLGSFNDLEFSREGLGEIARLARIMYRKNPLINRGVELQKLYVWGQGISVSSKDTQINDTCQEFLDEFTNQRAITGAQARGDLEKELQVTGNVYIVCFLPQTTADTLLVRTIPFEEITDIIRNPEDRSEPWFYKRAWIEEKLDPIYGSYNPVQREAYYPDWLYDPDNKFSSINDNPIVWDSPIYSIKVGGFAHDAFGTSEVYAALDWAFAHKENLENWSTITKALARFAWRMKVGGGSAGVAGAKAKIGTTVSSDNAIETNQPPLPGSTFISSGDTEMEPIRTAGATSSPSDSKYLLLQVCAALGLPEFFFGNAEVGNYATSKTLDRPTEMKFLERQELWKRVWIDLCTVACSKRGFSVKKNSINVEFPPMLEHDVENYVRALSEGVTLNGHPNLVIPDMREVAKLLLRALGEDDIDETIEKMFTDKFKPVDPTPPEPQTKLQGPVAGTGGGGDPFGDKSKEAPPTEAPSTVEPGDENE